MFSGKAVEAALDEGGGKKRDLRVGLEAVDGRFRRAASVAPPSFPRMPRMIFIDQDGMRHEVEAPVGLSVLEIAHRNDIDIEGACEGSLACSTCHVILDAKDFTRLPEPSEDEEDMLDLAWGLTQTSRLGCQIVMTEDLDGLTVSLPDATRNMLLEG